jgi:uncharacterized protein (DUF58 family)
MKRVAPKPGPGAPLSASTPRLGRQDGLELAARRVLDGLHAGRHRSVLHGSSIDFAEHRPYQAGDELRTIDWRAFARTDRLLIRRFHDDRQLPLALIVDGSASMAYGHPEKFATAQLVAAALGLLALDQGDAVRVLCDGAIWSPELGGAPGVTRLMELLEAATGHGAAAPARALHATADRLERRSLVVLVSDLLCEIAALARSAADLVGRGHELAVIQVLDRTEVDLPAAWGRVTMIDPEGVERPFDCDTGEARMAFAAAIADHIAQCRRLLAGVRADHVLLVSDEPVALVLGAWLVRRRRR